MSLEEIKTILDNLRSQRNKLSVEIKYRANRYNVKKFRSKKEI